MGDVYQFSESSLPFLDRCIEVANQPGREWMALLKSNNTCISFEKSPVLNLKIENVSSNASTQIIEHEDNVTDNVMEDVSWLPTEEAIERIRATLEMESNKLDYLIAELENYDKLLPVLAVKLSSSCIEAICNEVFFSRPNCIEKFYVEFLAVYLTRNSAVSSLELLIKAHEAHSEAFKSLIVTLLTSNSPILVLENFFTTIDSTERSQILQSLCMAELSMEAFVQHINSISYLYKNSEKTPEIQNFIFKCLTSSAKACSKDKNYGKFLLLYFQSLKDCNTKINKYELEQLIKTHETSFARLCSNMLTKYK